MESRVNPRFWQGKKVFLTGHTGFKGGWASIWLKQMGATVKGFSLAPTSKHSLFEEADISADMLSEIGDIRNLDAVTRSMRDFNPDIVFHMAAQPLVRLSYREPVETYSTNVMGTVHVLEAARNCSNLKAIVNITTDKCYENREWEWGYRENEPMGGHDPYSNSKGCAELVTSAYRRSFFNKADTPALASVRAGNVIGGGDWAEDRLLPDILKAFENSQPVVIRNPNATRPWQHVLEPLSGYFLLAEALYTNENRQFADGWNFGPNDDDVQPVSWICDHMVNLWKRDARWELDAQPNPHEANYLKLDISKAKKYLNWHPQWNLGTALEKIVHWHQSWLDGAPAQQLCVQHIEDYNNTRSKEAA